MVHPRRLEKEAGGTLREVRALSGRACRASVFAAGKGGVAIGRDHSIAPATNDPSPTDGFRFTVKRGTKR